MLTDDEIMAQVLAAFQEEQAEHRQAIADILLELEKDTNHPKRAELVVQLFREAHSLKGGARAAGLDAVEQLAHKVEDIFSAVRQDELTLTASIYDVVYATLDAIGTLMGQVAAGQPESLEPYQPLLTSLEEVLKAEAPPAAASPPAIRAAAPEQSQPAEPASEPQPVPPPSVRETVPPAPRLEADAQPLAPGPKPAPPAAPADEPRSLEDAHWETASTTVRLSTAMLDSLMNETGELITTAVRAQQRAHDVHEMSDIPARWRRIWRQVNPIIKRLQKQKPELQPTVHHLHDRDKSIKSYLADASEAILLGHHETFILLESLMQANMLLSDMEHHLSVHTRALVEDSARLSSVTGRLQDQIRRTRMLPLNTLLSPLRIQMREMVRIADKQIELTTHGGEVEADRQVLDGLREVLLHLLRNAVDHGIEPTEERLAKGKPPAGRISLSAVVSGDYLDLSISDDGAGLNVDAIKQRALSEGIISESDLARFNEADLLDLVFLSGFSTRQTVSKLSGRGVGLDVVRSQIERMHGQVTVQSVPQVGCTFSMRVPLSLTSSHGLLIQIGRGTYMLPLESIQRIVPVSPGDIHIVEGRAAITVDKHPLALIHLADLLGEKVQLTMNNEKAAAHTESGQSAIIHKRSLALLLGSGERQVACLVDAVLGEQELVVHRLPAPLQRVHFIAGATILADGKVVPILDLVDILRAAIGTRGSIRLSPEQHATSKTPTVLVVDDSITTRTLEKNILEAAGYYVKLAIDGAEALQVLYNLVDNGGCDLLLSDIDMPNLNGFELTSQVRNDPTLKHLPIVLVTSLDTPADRERGLSAGADAYIVKRAFDQQILLDTIAQLI